MKRLRTIIPSILLASTLLHADVGIDSVGANIGLSWIESTQTDKVGSISFSHQPDEFYGHLELYSLFSGVFHDKSYKPSLNIIGNINGDFNNALLLAGINKYFVFNHYNLYAGALIGGGVLEWKYNPLVATDIQKYDTTSPVGALQVGGEYKLSKNILLTLNAKFYLHNYSTSIKSNATNNTEIAHKTSESLSFGIRIPFGISSTKTPKVEQKQEVKEKREQEEKPKQEKEQKSKPKKILKPKVVVLDSDKDGVVDAQDRCKATPSEVIVNSQGCGVSYDVTVHFAINSAKIPKSDKLSVVKFINFLMANPKYNAEIIAHTDTTGPEIYNQKLSIQRAKTVYDYLIRLGIDKNRLSYKGFGSTAPIASNDTEEGRAANRRIEVRLSK